MCDRYLVKCNVIPIVSCASERDALRRAASLFASFGREIEIEIYLNEVSDDGLLYSKAWMEQWFERHGDGR